MVGLHFGRLFPECVVSLLFEEKTFAIVSIPAGAAAVTRAFFGGASELSQQKALLLNSFWPFLQIRECGARDQAGGQQSV
jgi:hypothetical protein